MDRLTAAADRLDGINRAVGAATAWCATFLALTQFGAVASRHFLGVNLILLQDATLYLHGMIFLLGAGYTLLMDAHIRVDPLQRDASAATRAWIELLGTLFLLLPFCAVLFWYALPYVGQSWAVLEGPREQTAIPLVYVLKGGILVFAALLAIQGAASLFRGLAILARGCG